MIYRGEVFEKKVLELLTGMATKNEEIFRNAAPALHGGDKEHVQSKFYVYADLYFPNGLKALDFDKDKYVEIRQFLSYNAVNHCKQLVSQLDDKSHLVFILEKEYPGFNEALGIPSNNVSVITFQKLSHEYKKYKEISPNEVNNEEITSNINDDNNNAHISQKTIETDDSKITIKNASDDFKNGNITLVLGAGVSASAKLPAWDSLLKALLTDSSQDPLDDSDYSAIGAAAFHSNIIKARYILASFVTHKDKDTKIVKIMHDALYRDYNGKSSDLIKTIAEICKEINPTTNQRLVSSIITFNYDDLIEEALTANKVDFSSIFKDGKYEANKLPVVHVHGIINRNDTIYIMPVLSEEAYHDLYRRGNSWANVELLHAFYRTTCIFIGLSMSDPNLRRLLEFVHAETGDSLQHYAILPSKTLSNHNWDSQEPQKYYEKKVAKEEAFKKRQEDVFHQLGIQVIWYPDGKFEEIPEILKQIAGLKP